MITPILIPTNTEREKCKNCKHDLYIKRTCEGCGYEIEYNDLKFPYWYISVILNIVTLYTGAYILKLIPLFEWYYMPTILLIVLSFVAISVFSWFIISE